MKTQLPIIILHGWSLSGMTFDPLTNILKMNGWKVLAPTMPGFTGGNPIDRPYTLDDYAEYVINFCRKQKISRALFIGHSFGGRVAIKLAAQFPKVVAALILTGAPGYSSSPWYKFWTKVILAKTGKLLFSTPFLLPAQDAVRSFYYLIIGVKDYTKANTIMRLTFKNVVAENLHSPMTKIHCPTKLIWGAQDQLVPLSVARRMVKVINSSSLVTIPFTDHGVPFKEPEKFYSAARDFLDMHRSY